MKKLNNYIPILFICLLVGSSLQAQDDMLSELGEDPITEIVTNAFKSNRVVNSHSAEMVHAGALDFRILHRFGKVNQGLYDMFGLDQATMRMSFDYGLTDNLTIGLGRATRGKELDGFIKFRLKSQTTGAKHFPVSLVWVSGMVVNGLKDPFGTEIDATFGRRTSYYHQLIICRKFNENFSLQLSPMVVHRNLTTTSVDPNTLIGMELGTRYKLSKRIALVLDYVHAFNRFPGRITDNPLSVGIDIETGGHVFQLHFSNAIGMNERSFIADNNPSWLDGNIQFGFNLSRTFQVGRIIPAKEL